MESRFQKRFFKKLYYKEVFMSNDKLFIISKDRIRFLRTDQAKKPRLIGLCDSCG